MPEINSIKEIAELIILILGSGGLGGVFIWLYMVKYEKEKNISAAKKETKVNNVDGDNALVEQIDMLLLKFAAMSEAMVKIQQQLSIATNTEYSYRTAMHQIELSCKMVCKDADYCIARFDKILQDLKLKEHITKENGDISI